MKTVAVGGTFNIIHIGHEALLDRAFQLGDLIHIGLTSDELANAHRKRKVRSYKKRRRALARFINSRDYGKEYTIVSLDNGYGLTLEKELDYLVVSPETEPMGEKINVIRKERGRTEIQISVVEHVLAEDGKPVSATRIGNHEITPDGKRNLVFTETTYSNDLLKIDNAMVDGANMESGPSEEKRAIVVHICCAPCLATPLPKIREGFQTVGFFYNPNIQPFQEYRKRLETVRDFSQDEGLPVIYKDDYDPERFMKGVVGAGMEYRTRCAYCYEDRLETTAKVAKELGFTIFTTSLLSSPHQIHEKVHEIGEKVAEKYGLEFLYYDERSSYKAGVDSVRQRELYVQNYCGCLFSERDRYCKQLIGNDHSDAKQLIGNDHSDAIQ